MIDSNSDYIQQGDVLFFKVKDLPDGLKKVRPKGQRHIIAEGEATGHAHAIHGLGNCEVFSDEGGTLYIRASKAVQVVHEEHHARTIPAGVHRIGKVREIDPFSEVIREVRD